MARQGGAPERRRRGRRPSSEDEPTTYVPAWVRKLGTAAWLVDDQARVRFINPRAERLLGVAASDCIGKPCYEVIAGTDDRGQAFCRPLCPVLQRALSGKEIEPLPLRLVGAHHRGRWIELLAIVVRRAGRIWLIECALDVDRAHGCEDYLAKIAGGAASRRDPRLEALAGLTAREQEILGHLAAAESLAAIATKLHRSHATVRNHVQHILEKLSVHSIQEAIALHLLNADR